MMESIRCDIYAGYKNKKDNIQENVLFYFSEMLVYTLLLFSLKNYGTCSKNDQNFRKNI